MKSHLTKKIITDKNGHKRAVWVKTDVKSIKDAGNSLEADSKEMKKKKKEIHKRVKEVGFKSPEGQKLMKEESKMYKEFQDKYGKDALVEFHMGKKSNFGKMQNSRGQGYGNQ